MIENLVFFTLGALIVALIALLVIPVIWHRAARLIEQRIRATTPLSMAEIKSEKDLVRAEFAVRIRKLEVRYEEIKSVAAERQIELGRRHAKAQELETELADREETIDTLEKRLEETKSTILGHERQIALQSTALKEKQHAISVANDALLARSSESGELKSEADSRRIENASLGAQLESYKSRVVELRAELATRSIESEKNSSEVDELTGVIRGRNAKIAALNKRVARRRDLSRQRRQQTKELVELLAAQRERVAEKTAALSAAELARMKYQDDIRQFDRERVEFESQIAALKAELAAASGDASPPAQAGEARSSNAVGVEPAAPDMTQLREFIADLAARITRIAADEGDSEVQALIDAVTVDSRDQPSAAVKAKSKARSKKRIHLAERIKEADLAPGE